MSTNVVDRAEAVIENEHISEFLSHLACQLALLPSSRSSEVAWAEPLKALLREQGAEDMLRKVERDYT